MATQYIEGLQGVGDIQLPKVHSDAMHAWHLFVIRTKRRNELQEHLKKHQIRAGLHYPIAAHQQPAIQEVIGKQSLPLAEQWAEECLTLPLSHEHSDEEIAYTIQVIRNFFGEV